MTVSLEQARLGGLRFQSELCSPTALSRLLGLGSCCFCRQHAAANWGLGCAGTYLT